MTNWNIYSYYGCTNFLQMDNHRPQFNVWFLIGWYGTTVTSLVFASLLTIYISTAKVVKPVGQSFRLYAALPQTNTQVSDEIEKTDARAKIIENFLTGYKSPLAKYSNNFVEIADKYNLDYRLLPAIAMQESNGGRKVINDSFNPFGYGIYGSMKLKFNSWDEAIERVGRALREDYLNMGLTTPEKIMAKYTPPSLEKGGVWAKGVSSFMLKLR